MSTENVASSDEATRANGEVESVVERGRSEEDPTGGRLLPADSEQTPTLSVVMPTLNEEAGVGECIERVRRALDAMGVTGEVVVSDSSTDRTPEIAESMGARVVEPDEPGYGYAYQYAFDRARGDYLAIGDADTTYDFEELPKLYELVAEGDADMAMGSRLDGEIRPGAMPALHQYVGNPLLTKFLNVFYGAGVSDAHSGMRVISREALDELELRTTGMEFASEMIMEAGAQGLTIAEVPITYHPREGEATLESFSDGWRHVKFMLQNAPGYLFSMPGILMMLVGGGVMGMMYADVSVGGVTFGSHSLVASAFLLFLGFQLTSLGAFATVAGNPIRKPTDPVTRLLTDRLTLKRGAVSGLAVFLLGAALVGVKLLRWAANGFPRLSFQEGTVLAFVCVIFGLQLVFGSFFVDSLRQP